jgi:peptidoglycan/xylan/chitin deacetylase (PgdA/CDA1 family)
MRAVVWYNVNLKARTRDELAQVTTDATRFITRGSIVNMNFDGNPLLIESIAYLAASVRDTGYTSLNLDDLVANSTVRKPFEQIAGNKLIGKPVAYNTQPFTVLKQLKTTQKRITLTFDDFGSDKTVNGILDVLDELDIPATFFVRVKGAERNPNLVRDMVERGYEVGSHSYSHQIITTLSDEELIEDTRIAHEILTEALQQPPLMVYRPPTGVVDERTGRILSAMGYKVIALYDVTTLDWDNTRSAQVIYDIVMDEVKAGSIILLHMLDDIHTTEALPRIVKDLQAQGYTFVSMSEMLESYGYVQNVPRM